MSKQIVFEGYLNDMYPDGIFLDFDSPAEGIALLENFPGFKVTDDVRHFVALPDFPSHSSLYERTEKEVIRVVPFAQETFEGSGGKGGVLQVIIGVIIIAVGVIAEQPWLIKIGASLVLGGVIQMLMPQPSKETQGNDPKSQYLAANKNTTAIGTPIPLAFGRRKIFGHLLSFNVTATNINQPSLIGTTTQSAVANTNNDIDYSVVWGSGS